MGTITASEKQALYIWVLSSHIRTITGWAGVSLGSNSQTLKHTLLNKPEKHIETENYADTQPNLQDFCCHHFFYCSGSKWGPDESADLWVPDLECCTWSAMVHQVLGPECRYLECHVFKCCYYECWVPGVLPLGCRPFCAAHGFLFLSLSLAH